MISLPKKPKIIQEHPHKAIFEIEALYPGYGVTVGNSLRRVLFSSLEGAAITKVKIKGVAHEFSTIKGISEDVISILLNLKKIRLKMYSPESQVASLKVKGEKEVKAGDFKLPPQVEIINKDLHIATLAAKDTVLEMEIQIEKGIGYEPVERRKKEKLEIGSIALDAIYTPIRNVAFRIENMRVGERTDYDRLLLEIETDGTILPGEAFARACKILVSHFSLLGESLEEEIKEKPKKVAKKKSQDVLKLKIQDLQISARTIKVLHDNSIKSVGGLLRKKEEDLRVLKGMGEKGLKEIKKALKKLDLNLKSET